MFAFMQKGFLVMVPTVKCFVVVASMYDTGSVQTSYIVAENRDEATMLAINSPEYLHFYTLVVLPEYETENIAREIECAKKNAETAKLFGQRLRMSGDL